VPAVIVNESPPPPAEQPSTPEKLRELPRDVGVMLVAAGACGVVLPGMVGTPAILAGGLVLWPRAFGRVETWFGQKFPRAHREGMRQIGRYLDDLDRRYAYSSQSQSDRADTTLADPQPSRSEAT
jgi:hypothetical protein